MNDTAFPCLFSKRAWGAKTIRVIFCDRRKDGDFSDFLQGIIQYSHFIHSTPLNKRIFAPLVVFFSQDFNTNKSQHETGWEALKWIHAHDIHPWPSHIATDPGSADWTFCFNNIQFFINMSTKDHKVLRNRNLGMHLTFVINARENFDAVANGKTKGGRQIREHIRERVKIYNDGAFPQELGFYGEEDNLEWKQYQLAEEGVARPHQCPFSSKHKLNSSDEGSKGE
ncbi:YqcI/YcgG family protein [Serratia sp. NPDC078593]|uniref:YqcI/YcgG family protein n=1 Tax=unclassified Serratia (in: enterobacteria) TaxID=2647522 RepID=UPI0037D4BD1C